MSKCRHDNLRGIYGDEINNLGGKRSECTNCFALFDSLPPSANGDTSDGYHTFKELYEFRMLYNAAFFNEVAYAESQYGGSFKPVKSWKHSDGEIPFGGGWFVVSVQLPTGQITNHYEEKDWGLFNIPEVETAPEWDGHTAQDVIKRLKEYLS